MQKKKLSRNWPWRQSVSVGSATVLSDYIWARYVGHIADGSPVTAAHFGALVIVLGAFIVVSYVNDKRLILPAAIGAWVGTYLGVS